MPERYKEANDTEDYNFRSWTWVPRGTVSTRVRRQYLRPYLANHSKYTRPRNSPASATAPYLANALPPKELRFPSAKKDRMPKAETATTMTVTREHYLFAGALLTMTMMTRMLRTRKLRTTPWEKTAAMMWLSLMN